MKFGSLFRGVGGFDLGFERAGMECVITSEIDKYANAVMAYHNNIPNIKDVKDVGKLGAIDLICGGFPCQDLSVAGNRAGLAGERSGLWLEFARIIEINKPRWVVIENVPGLLSSDKGRDMGIFTGKLAELGYWWAYRVLDSQNFGVAQRRRRVFIVANLTDPTGPTKVLFEPESGERDTKKGSQTGKASPPLTGTGVSAGRTGNERNELDFCIPDVTPTLVGVQRGKGRDALVPSYWDGGQIADTSNVSTITKGQMMPDKRRFPVVLIETAPSQANQNNIKSARVSGTLDGANSQAIAWKVRGGKEGGGKGYLGQYLGVRRLTPLECERLQGFPDGWTKYGIINGETVEISDTQRYKMMGNAVTVNVAEWIGRRIASHDNQ